MGPADGAGADRVVPPAGGHQRVGVGGAHLFQHGLLDGFGWAMLDSPGGVEAGEYSKRGPELGGLWMSPADLLSVMRNLSTKYVYQHTDLSAEIFAASYSRVKEQLSASGQANGVCAILYLPLCTLRQPGVDHSVVSGQEGLYCEHGISAAWGCFVRYLRDIQPILWHGSLATEELCMRVT